MATRERTHDAREDVRLGSAGAHGFGWCVLALVNAVLILLSPFERSLKHAVVHHFYDAGHMMALGLIGTAGMWLGTRCWAQSFRWRRRRIFRVVGVCVVLAGALALGDLTLADDLSSFASRQAQAGSSLPWHWIAVVAANAMVGVVALAAAMLVRRRLGWLCLPVGLALGVLNHLILELNYPGAHLYVAIVAATLLGAGLMGRRLPRRLMSPRVMAVSLLVLGAWSLFTLVWLPDARTWRDVFRLPGAVLAPFLSRLHPLSEEIRPSRRLSSPWYQSREAAPSVPPTPRTGFPAQPIVLMITADAVRADLLEGDQYRNQLPNLHALRDASANFVLARSPSPSTATTFTAIYTGKYYSATHWSSRKESWERQGKSVWPRSDRTPRLAALLGKAGVDTINMRTLNAFSRASGIGRGFSEEIKVGHYTSAAKGRKRLEQRLRKQGSKPLFAAMHWIDPHAPYTSGGAKRIRGSDFDRYLREVAYVDTQLGLLLRELEKPAFKDRTLLIFAADHGEAFGEHNSRFHAGTLYEELLRVPLLFRGPGIVPRKVDVPVSLIDLGPTLLDLFGQETPGWFMGQSLVPFLIGERTELTRPIAAEGGRRMQAMVFPDGYKAIVDLRRNTQEVYDLRVDPRELNNLAGTNSRADLALNDLRLFFSTHQLKNYEPPWRMF